MRGQQVFRKQIGRAVEGEAEKKIAQGAEAEIAAAEQPEIDQRLGGEELEQDEGAERGRRQQAQFDDEGRAEPVIDIAVVEERYEDAAMLRDELKRLQSGEPPGV